MAGQPGESATGSLAQALLRRDRLVVIACLAALTLIAWTYLLLGAGMDMTPMEMDGQMMVMAPEWTAAYFGLVLLMWVVMMLAMMLPSAAPVILLVASIARRQSVPGDRVQAAAGRFALGYVTVWLGFSVAATALQWSLETAGLLDPETMGIGSGIAGIVLVAAGLYQFTPLKQTCLRHCRSPLDFLLEHGQPTARSAFRIGVRHGVFCLGCCWMLMALLFVGGLMNLIWIGGLSLLVLVEKVLPRGGGAGKISGLAMIGWGTLMLHASL